MNTWVDAKTFEKAIIYAAKKHKGQVRKGDGRPYILHPMSVMNRVYSMKASSNIFTIGTAAILHDVVEDCGVSIKKIAKKFGYTVASLVEELTLDKNQYETMGKIQYLCQEVAKMSSYALRIKLCDRLDNVSDLKTMSKDFRDRYIAETYTILATVNQRSKLTKTHVALVALIEEELKKLLS